MGLDQGVARWSAGRGCVRSGGVSGAVLAVGLLSVSTPPSGLVGCGRRSALGRPGWSAVVRSPTRAARPAVQAGGETSSTPKRMTGTSMLSASTRCRSPQWTTRDGPVCPHTCSSEMSNSDRPGRLGAARRNRRRGPDRTGLVDWVIRRDDLAARRFDQARACFDMIG
jgi:hypothetical protein